jgi:hypothetical protein
MRKKIIKFIVIIIVLFTINSCTKESYSNLNKEETGQKTKIESSATSLSSQNPEDSLKAIADKSFGIIPPSTTSPVKGLNTTKSGGVLPSVETNTVTPFIPPGCYSGNYIATGISSGGMFSSFIVTFDNNYGTISNFGLSLSGFGIGWSWLTGTTT